MFVGLCSVCCSARKIRMCPTSLCFSSGALPCPDGLGGLGWVVFPTGLWKAGVGVRFLVGAMCLELGRGRDWSPCAFWETGTGSRELILQSVLLTGFRSTASAKICALVAAPHLSLIRCLLRGVSIKGAACVASSLALSRAALCVSWRVWACFSSLYFIAASRKRRGRFPLFPEVIVYFFPLWIILSHVLLAPSHQSRIGGSWNAVDTAGEWICCRLHWTGLRQWTSFSWAFRSLNEFGICDLSAILGMCRHSRCLPNMWLY